MTVEIEYISMEGRHVVACEEADSEEDAIDGLYQGSGDDPYKIISVEVLT